MRIPLLALLLAGCGAAAPTARLARVEATEIRQWEQGDCAAVEAAAGAPSLSLPVRAPARQAVRIQRPAPLEARRGRRIDLRLEHARLASALRLLADAADVGIVIGEGLDDEISVDLRRVRPVEAMQALAQAYGVELSMVGRTVIARR